MIHVTTINQRRCRTDIRRAHRSLLLLPLRRVALLATLAAPAALLSGCVINLDGASPGSNMGSNDSGMGMSMSTPPGQRLPPPSVPRVDPPTLDADQQKRLDEIEQYLDEQYKALGWQIMATTQGFSGDIFDWVDPNSVEGSQEEPPPTPTPEEMQLPDGIQLQLTELDVFPELRGPDGTIPMLRPSFAAYLLGHTGATSLDDWISNYQVVGVPDDPNRLYAGMRTIAANHGANVSINSYGGLIDPDTLSVLEMVVGCRDQQGVMWQQIGIASSRDNVNLNNIWGELVHPADSLLRLQVEFLAGGPDHKGNKKGGWDGIVRGFIPANFRPYPPGITFATSTISTVGGPQYESLYQIKIVANGDWWVGHNGHWLGRYPHELFDDAPPPNLIASKACEVAWYGEVYAKTPVPWTKTDMGSGQFAANGWPNVAYFRDPSYVGLDAAGSWSWPDSDPKITLDVPGSNDACYTRTGVGSGPAPWEQFFYVGGPGAEAQGCTGPKQP